MTPGTLGVNAKTFTLPSYPLDCDNHLYDQSDRDVLAAVADQVTIALERKRAEVALRESEERYRALADTTFEAVLFPKRASVWLPIDLRCGCSAMNMMN